MKEYVVLVDEKNTALGTMDKYEAHFADTPLHRGFSVFLFTSKGELLLQKRSEKKKTWPLIWSNSCCGHPMMDERVIDAGKRRLSFELNLTSIDLSIILPSYRYRYEHKGVVENEICPVMIGFTDELPIPNPDEVAETRYVPWKKFLEEISSPNEYSEWCVEEAQLLEKNPEFHKLFSLHTSLLL